MTGKRRATQAACWLVQEGSRYEPCRRSCLWSRVKDLAKTFDVSAPWLNRVLEGKPRQQVHAVDGVSFSIERGKTLALVGESGCGKSTVARLLVSLYAPTAGEIRFDGQATREVLASPQAGCPAAPHADDFSRPLCQPEPALARGRHRG